MRRKKLLTCYGPRKIIYSSITKHYISTAVVVTVTKYRVMMHVCDLQGLYIYILSTTYSGRAENSCKDDAVTCRDERATRQFLAERLPTIFLLTIGLI